jgi:hypothetical protein
MILQELQSIYKILSKFAKSCKILPKFLSRFLRDFLEISCKNRTNLVRFFKDLIHILSSAAWFQTHEQNFKLSQESRHESCKVLAKILQVCKNLARILTNFFNILVRIFSRFLSRDIFMNKMV